MSLPVVVEGANSRSVERISLDRAEDAAMMQIDELWLQNLIHQCPSVLAVDEIEPGFGRLVPLAREVPCGHGYIDNLFITGDGGIVVVEVKLWRNPDARRKVVAQVLDYAAALSAMSYQEFEQAVLNGHFSNGDKPSSLHGVVADTADALDEASFIDAVSLNLRRGRMIVLAVGDGIRRESELLADLLQSHAGARFTFALVAIDLFRLSNDQILAVPRPLAKTTLVERGVVRIEDGRITVESQPVTPASPARTQRITMTEEIFMEAIARRDTRLPAAIREFLQRLAILGVEPEWLQSLNLKWNGWPNGKPVNLGYIRKNGGLSSDATNWVVGVDLATSYERDLAQVVGGKAVLADPKAGYYLTAADGKSSVKIETVLPERMDAWVDAIARFIDRLKIEATKGTSEEA